MEKEYEIKDDTKTNSIWDSLENTWATGLTVASNIMPNIIEINNPGTNFRTPLVVIKPDGEVEFGEGYMPDEAAKLFWEAIASFSPQCQAQRDLVQANNKIAEHKREISFLKQRITDLEMMMWGPHGS